jgi:hypothetical protein
MGVGAVKRESLVLSGAEGFGEPEPGFPENMTLRAFLLRSAAKPRKARWEWVQ